MANHACGMTSLTQTVLGLIAGILKDACPKTRCCESVRKRDESGPAGKRHGNLHLRVGHHQPRWPHWSGIESMPAAPGGLSWHVDSLVCGVVDTYTESHHAAALPISVAKSHARLINSFTIELVVPGKANICAHARYLRAMCFLL